jgi:hypothetical protein
MRQLEWQDNTQVKDSKPRLSLKSHRILPGQDNKWSLQLEMQLHNLNCKFLGAMKEKMISMTSLQMQIKTILT